MFKKHPPTVIGINPGAKYLGIAVFRGSELLDWRIKATSGKWSDEKIEKILSIIKELITQYRPDALAIKKLKPCRSSENLDKLVERIKQLCEREGIKIHEYPIKVLEGYFSKDKINKRKLAEIIATRYPVLFHELVKEKGIGNPYYIRMFEAVALASVCSHQLDNLIVINNNQKWPERTS